ncbi:hypothetical protein EUGRSUZ_H00869 [Eucalyptus grandis]|uniref:Uncharacterized protein n=2 Tax=Eucalyptus grandis TaxID=71139 RepID=A0ACC3JMU7_EUCGR|nr:hypothetical protein EUGRSUZ_H00869 [Eucalyptus grandis]
MQLNIFEIKLDNTLPKLNFLRIGSDHGLRNKPGDGERRRKCPDLQMSRCSMRPKSPVSAFLVVVFYFWSSLLRITWPLVSLTLVFSTLGGRLLQTYHSNFT